MVTKVEHGKWLILSSVWGKKRLGLERMMLN